MREQGQRRVRAKTHEGRGRQDRSRSGGDGRYYERSTGRSHELAEAGSKLRHTTGRTKK